MKKTFIYLATFAVAMASCSKNETVGVTGALYDSKVINFAPSTGLTKSNDVGIDSLKQVAAGFEVFAMVKDDAGEKLFFTEPTTDQNHYKYDATAAEGLGAWGWGSATGKKWPEADKFPMTFIATYPSKDFKANYGRDAGKYVWTELITQAATTDITVDELSAVTNQLTAPAKGQLASMQFKHIMSNIKFNVIAPKGYTVHVSKLVYHNLHNENTYDYLTQTWAEVETASKGLIAYDHRTAKTGSIEKIEITGDAKAIASNQKDGATMKVVPQNFATSWDLVAFKAAGKAWDGVETWPTTAATTALTSGTYVEMAYALVDDKGVSIVGKVKGSQMADAGGNLTPYEGDTQLLRVGYKVDLETKPLEPAKRYTYQIELGTATSTNGTILDNTLVKDDGTEGDKEEDKKPGDDVNEKATDIGFSVDVEEWDDQKGSIE